MIIFSSVYLRCDEYCIYVTQQSVQIWQMLRFTTPALDHMQFIKVAVTSSKEIWYVV